MSIDINRLGPAAREQVRRQLEEQKRAREGRDATSSGPAGHLPLEGKALDGGNKLNAVKTDGYASKHEAERAAELRWMEKVGKIRDLREQVRYELIPAKWEEIPQFGKKGQPIKPKRRCVQRGIRYIADFCYIDCESGEEVVEDAKGYRTKDYIIKKKLMLEKYGIQIKEV